MQRRHFHQLLSVAALGGLPALSAGAAAAPSQSAERSAVGVAELSLARSGWKSPKSGRSRRCR